MKEYLENKPHAFDKLIKNGYSILKEENDGTYKKILGMAKEGVPGETGEIPQGRGKRENIATNKGERAGGGGRTKEIAKYNQNLEST